MRRLLALLGAVALLALLGACGSDDGGGEASVETEVGAWGGVINPGGEPQRGGTLRIDQATPPEGISPLYFLEAPSNPTIQVLMQVFDQLVELEPGGIEPQPGLAEEWDVSPDGLTYTFKLREAEFSNGMPVTPADVRYSLERAKDSVFADLFAPIAKIETPDAATVVLRLSDPAPGMLYSLAFPGASIMPAEVVEEMGDDAYNRKPIGSGPFVVESWRRDQQVSLARNDRYWREGQPYLDGVELIAVPDGNTRVLNVRSGSTDVADSIPFSQIGPINESGTASVLVAPGADMYIAAVNNSVKPFDETAVRRALNYATPVDQIVDVVFNGEAPTMNTITPKLKYWTDQAKAYPHDVERAKEELAKSSVPDGFKATVEVTGADQASNQTAQVLKEAWAEIGVDLTIDSMDDATRTENLQSGNYEVSITPPGRFTSDIPIDDQFAVLLFDSPAINNLFTHYDNPELAELTRKAISATDEDERVDLFEQLHVEAMEDPAVVPIAYTPNRAAVRNEVHAFNYLLNGWWVLDGVWKEGGGE